MKARDANLHSRRNEGTHRSNRTLGLATDNCRIEGSTSKDASCCDVEKKWESVSSPPLATVAGGLGPVELSVTTFTGGKADFPEPDVSAKSLSVTACKKIRSVTLCFQSGTSEHIR